MSKEDILQRRLEIRDERIQELEAAMRENCKTCSANDVCAYLWKTEYPITLPGLIKRHRAQWFLMDEIPPCKKPHP